MEKAGWNTRDDLLAAAADIVLRQGLAELSLNAVVEASGISKGGLLHHFPTRQHLVDGLLRMLLDRFYAAVEQRHDTLHARGERHAWLKAYLLASFEEDAALTALRTTLGAFTDYPPARERVMQDAARWMERFTSDGLSAARIAIIQYAAHAQRHMAIRPQEASQQQAIVAELFRLIEEE